MNLADAVAGSQCKFLLLTETWSSNHKPMHKTIEEKERTLSLPPPSFLHEMTSKPPPAMSPEAESIQRSLDEICSVPSDAYPWENPRRFSSLARRLQLALCHLVRSPPSPDLTCSTTVQTVLKGIAVDLGKVAETVAVYRERSKVFVLINCHPLCSALQDRASAIGSWLALLDSVLADCGYDSCQSVADLRKKIADLSNDLKQAQFRVTKNEARVYCTLQKEGQGRPTTRAVQSAIIMDLARALGVDSTDYTELSEQVKLLKNDLARSNSVSERRILISLERIMTTWSVEDSNPGLSLAFDDEDGSHIMPFKNFICPLTKEVMRDPVVLESSQTYERAAIEYWFQRCLEDGRDPTCPVSGQVLKSLEQKPNIGLAGAIEEWLNRNIDIQIKLGLEYLSEDNDPSKMGEFVEKVLDSLYKISEEHPSSRYKIRNAGIVVLITNLLKNGLKNSVGSQLRCKALMVLLSMASDQESKTVMLGERITKLVTRSLLSSSDKEKECALRLLLKLSQDEATCVKISSEKGALVLLSSLAGNPEDPVISNLSESVFKQLELVVDNVQALATAGRFEPLISRLCEGPDDVKARMASILGQITLTNSNKEQITRQTAKALIHMLSMPTEGMISSLRALNNLSYLDDCASILVHCSALPALIAILFENQEDDACTVAEHQDLSASVIANIVSKPGHWELAAADKQGHRMCSSFVISHLLGILQGPATSKCCMCILKILSGMASSAHASELVAVHLKAGGGIKTVIQFLEHQELELRATAFKLVRILSESSSEYISEEIKSLNKLQLLRDKVLTAESTCERSDAARILANLALSRDEVQAFLGDEFFRWTVTALKEQPQSYSGRGATSSAPTSELTEGLLGILILFVRDLQQQSQSLVNLVREQQIMFIFREQLTVPKPKFKQLGALGLKYLSQLRALMMSEGESDPQPPHGLCSSMVFLCGGRSQRTRLESTSCPIHHVMCDEDSQLCLLKCKCIEPLVALLINDEQKSVQVAALKALLTLIITSDSSSNGGGFYRAVAELEKLGVVDAVVNLFTETRSGGELQEKTLWMLERVFRCEGSSTRHFCNQALVRALVEALKHGNSDSKRYAQAALTYLQQLSGTSGSMSNQIRAQRYSNWKSRTPNIHILHRDTPRTRNLEVAM